MPREPIDLSEKIIATLGHVGSMPPEAERPLAHYFVGVNAAINMRRYVLHQLDKVGFYQAVWKRHCHVLDNMIIVNLVQAFERFIKDLASVCVDCLCDRVVDNRFDKLSVKGGFLAAHFRDSSPGRALCESGT